MNDAMTRRFEALLLTVLVLARIRIDTLAEAAVLPLRQQHVAAHPWLGSLLPPAAMQLLAQQQLVDPIGLLLIVLTLAALAGYLVIGEVVAAERARHYAKSALLGIILLGTVFGPAGKMMLLRDANGAASYCHDGGVIQTEATIDYLFQGRNPYVEDYLATPMAEWGIGEFRTALYHYPYLPWTFLFSAPFAWLSRTMLGWYDQRLVYLLLFAVTLLLLPSLAQSRQRKLMLVMLIGLNPIMGSDIIYGQNDSFVLAWLTLSAWAWMRGQKQDSRPWTLTSAAMLGLACASKPTAWFFVPFFAVLMAKNTAPGEWRRPGILIRRHGSWALAFVLPLLLVIGPYLAWSPSAMIDDVWRWSNGTATHAYQIWGWGSSNLVLALGWVPTRFTYWPFWLPQLVLGLPWLVWLGRRQWRENTLARAFWSYGLFLLVFFFFSRFLNENYLGFLSATMTLGALVDV